MGSSKVQNENILLRSLSASAWEFLAPALETVNLDNAQLIYELDGKTDYLYFPWHNTLLSLLATTKNGTGVELSVVGSEGVVPVSGILAAELSSHEVQVQIGGKASRLNTELARDLFRKDHDAHQVFLKYAHGLMVVISQTAICNRLHSLQERLARWLLVSNDRLERKELPFTHEILAKVLGASRATVSLTAGMLQESGLIQYRRGKIEIQDVEGLKEVACECYEVTKKAFQNGDC